MKALISQALAGDPMAMRLQASVLVLFVSIFVVVCFRVAGRSAKQRFDDLAEKLIQD